MSLTKKIAAARREYGEQILNEETLSISPLDLFDLWLNHELESAAHLDPTAMVLSTTDALGRPDSRVVLLKHMIDGQFVFYTNYLSTKAKQIDINPHVALNFFWAMSARQVRVKGLVKRTSSEQSDAYFASRPVDSQLSAILSKQSQEISSRENLLNSFQSLKQSYSGSIVRPDYWGGYQVNPLEIEFWQGCDHRLNDRILYVRNPDNTWSMKRIAP